jgi:hypothetical protein
LPAATAVPETSGLGVEVPDGIRVFAAAVDVAVRVGAAWEVRQRISGVLEPVWAVPHPARNASNHILCMRIEVIFTLQGIAVNFQ